MPEKLERPVSFGTHVEVLLNRYLLQEVRHSVVVDSFNTLSKPL
jgi:hypothetical protein